MCFCDHVKACICSGKAKAEAEGKVVYHLCCLFFLSESILNRNENAASHDVQKHSRTLFGACKINIKTPCVDAVSVFIY